MEGRVCQEESSERRTSSGLWAISTKILLTGGIVSTGYMGIDVIEKVVISIIPVFAHQLKIKRKWRGVLGWNLKNRDRGKRGISLKEREVRKKRVSVPS